MPDPDLLAEPTDTADAPSEGVAGHAGRPRDEAREQAILDAVIVVLAEVGYDRMTMDAVASTAKASKATIYRRWPGKAELVAAALHHRVVLGEQFPDRGSLRAELRLFVERVSTHVGGLDGDIVCGLAAASRNDPELAASIKSLFDDTMSSLDDVIARAQGRGELGPDADSLILFEVIPSVAVMHAMKGEPLDDTWVDHVTDHIAVPLVTYTSSPSIPPKEHSK